MRARLVNRVSVIALAAVGTFGIAAADSAHAAGIVFTFDTVGTITGLNDSSTNANITTYMDAVVKKANAAYGAVSLSDTTRGAEGETNYTGDNHVVGLTVTNGTAGQLPATPVGGGTYQLIGNSVVPLTLGNTDGFVENGTSSGLAQINNSNPYSPNGKVGHLTSLDAFVTNDVNNANPDKTTMAFQFSGGLVFNTIEFDFEIFPNGSCLTASCTAGLPDLTVKYKGSDNLMHTVSGTPFVGETPDGDTHSPISTKTGTELTPQLLSHASFTLPEATNEIWFVDWPNTIGIDNLYIGTRVPEPATLAMFAVGLAGLGVPAWRRRQRARTSV